MEWFSDSSGHLDGNVLGMKRAFRAQNLPRVRQDAARVAWLCGHPQASHGIEGGAITIPNRGVLGSIL
jgi:hypothetical protein